ncbi:acyltransferase [Fluoribacter gormanii]|uniref:acyltransferase n=1 Tax=Fluoribacter gormanii TaxID=464 RepID=UPI002242F868|nr:acyltransferase [Fluoribacter gormanii]MCW8445382.1 acyltransferase [Fluoribacter gormanii]
MQILNNLKQYIKSRKNPLSRFLYTFIVRVPFISLPAPKILFKPLLLTHLFIRNAIRKLLIFFYWKPLFMQLLESKPKYFKLEITLPFVLGYPSITLGENCIINGRNVIVGRSSPNVIPRLSIGNNVYIGYNAEFYIGNEIVIGDNCLIGEGCILRGYSGHSSNPMSRKARLPDEEDSVAAVILENNVWLCQDVKILPGVHIGENSVIGTGSVVTKDIPPNVLAAGVPAIVIKSLSNTDKTLK